MKKIIVAMALSLGMVSAALAADESGLTQAVRIKATVQSIDMETRAVTLKDASGKTISFVASDMVKNLPQVKVGDIVNLSYERALAVKLEKSTKTLRERGETQDIQSNAPGQKPGGTMVREVTVTASVEKINLAQRYVVLRGPKQTVEVDVRDPEILKRFKKGDFVDVVYREALMINVQAAK